MEYKNVLEIGGGEFATLKKIVSTYQCKGVGLDLRVPNHIGSDIEYIQCDLDNIDQIDLKFKEKFDLVIAGDVLEHTIYPEKICSFLNTIMSENGIFILSVPNIRSIRALFWIFVVGRFPREEKGLFDKTHRSWFTYYNLREILLNSGFRILKYRPLGRLEKIFFRRRSFVSEFLALQHSFLVQKNKLS